jgi:hypothetical protein
MKLVVQLKLEVQVLEATSVRLRKAQFYRRGNSEFPDKQPYLGGKLKSSESLRLFPHSIRSDC